MKLNKLFIYVLMFLISLSVVSAVTLNDAEAYYDFDNNSMDDSSGNGYTAADTGTSNTTGKLFDARLWNADTDRIQTFMNPTVSEFSFSLWVKSDDTNTRGFLSNLGNLGAGRDGMSIVQVAGTYQANLWAGGSSNSIDSGVPIVTGTYQHLVLTYNGTHAKYYVNNVIKGTNAIAFTTFNEDLEVGAYYANLGATTLVHRGAIDEVAVYNRELNTTEISALYNSSNGFNPYAGAPASAEIVVNNNISNYFLYNSTLNRYYINESIRIDTTITVKNTNPFVNGTLYVYNQSNDLIFSNQYYTGNLTSAFIDYSGFPSDGLYFLNTSYVNNETSTNETIGYVFFDTVAPNVTNITGNEINNYSVDFSTVFNVSDSFAGIHGCNINITELSNVTTPDNFIINCSDTQVFSSAGLHNAFVTAQDKSGNIKTFSWNFTINPFINITYQNKVTLVKLTDYTVNIYHPDGRKTTQTDVNGSILLSPVNNGGLDFGLHKVEFVKTGYILENTSVLVNASNAGINLLLNATQVTLALQVYDAENPTQQLPFNLTIINDTDSISYINQLNFTINYNETATGVIQIVINSIGYSQVYYWNELSPYTSINLTAYMFKTSSSSVIQFTVLDTADNSAIPLVTIELQKLINGSYATIAQSVTESSGKTFFFANTSLSYRAIFTKDGYTQAVATTIPGVLEYTLKLSTAAEAFTYVDDINYAFTPTTTELRTNESIDFSTFISGTSITLSNISLYYSNGTAIYQSSSGNPTGTTFTNTFTIPFGANVSSVTAKLTWVRDGEIRSATRVYSVYSFTNTSIMTTMLTFSNDNSEESVLFRWWVVMIITAMVITFGAITGVRVVNFMLVPVLAFFALVSWVDWVQAAVGIFIMLVFFIGGRR